MSEKNTEPGMAYSMPKLHKIMAFLSFIFFITVIWVFLDDYIRPWKGYQVEAMKIQRRHLDAQIEEVTKNIDEKKLADLKAQLTKAEEIVKSRKADLDVLDKQHTKIKAKIADQTIKNGILNGQVGAVNFKYETAESHEDMRTAGKKLKSLTALKKEFADGKDYLKALQAEDKEVLAKIADLNKEVTSTEKEIKDIVNTLNLLDLAKDRTKISPVFLLRNLPFIDFMDPTIKIRQIVINNINQVSKKKKTHLELTLSLI